VWLFRWRAFYLVKWLVSNIAGEKRVEEEVRCCCNLSRFSAYGVITKRYEAVGVDTNESRFYSRWKGRE
jgi:hypothetical protein